MTKNKVIPEQEGRKEVEFRFSYLYVEKPKKTKKVKTEEMKPLNETKPRHRPKNNAGLPIKKERRKESIFVYDDQVRSVVRNLIPEQLGKGGKYYKGQWIKVDGEIYGAMKIIRFIIETQRHYMLNEFKCHRILWKFEYLGFDFGVDYTIPPSGYVNEPIQYREGTMMNIGEGKNKRIKHLIEKDNERCTKRDRKRGTKKDSRRWRKKDIDISIN